MIAQLTGTVIHVGASALVLDVGGVGYRILATPATLAMLHARQEASLATHLVVREDSLTLFGFESVHERDMFETLQSVQGVGPRLALALLAVHAPHTLVSVIAAGDVKALQKVPGVGAKVAARLMLELGGKLSLPEDAVAPTVTADEREQVADALVALGWQARAALAAVEKVAPEPIAQDDVAATLRAALQTLGGSRG
ncbi:Holliday junction branch migration protein RuvA [Demequina sp. TTPB684]|uniref:Holliday junction branch migration protein RuvA n=1 Tax=unclassified Demequina TaxID=2620311 RepID=UPI001CF3A126|nr:Holliday junction branch migration protein RuvA [Demequina sp. TMPB413]MCB2414077.1 Holliday junction branch migration protein RuvA [Demequina sp. TTPB684]UPU89212.1 Holliday junction branch migration protein RuvA [Demequina sp. TMPB413]